MRRFLANLVDFFKPRCWYDVLCYVTAFPFALALFWAIAFPEFRGWSIDLQGSALDVATSAYGVATLLVGIAGFLFWRRLPFSRRSLPFLLTGLGVLMASNLIRLNHPLGSPGWEFRTQVQGLSIVVCFAMFFALCIYQLRTCGRKPVTPEQSPLNPATGTAA